MKYDPLYLPFASQRMVTYAKNGMVASSQPLAAQAGLDILKKGGNVLDSAVATAACLTVVEPTSNGIGGGCICSCLLQWGIIRFKCKWTCSQKYFD